MGESGSGSGKVQIGVLGRLRVSVDGASIDLPPGQLRVLLAILAMSAGHPVPVDRLAEAVWGEDLPGNARRTLQTYVTRLRRAMGSHSLETSPSGYALNARPDDVDALRFVALVDRAAREADDGRTLLAEALLLWRGAPFEDLDSRWLEEHEAPRLYESHLAALEQRVDLELAQGRAGDVVGELRALATRHPLREPLWARLLVVLAESGRTAEALEQYEVVRTRIADELGVDPGAELQRIYADLLDGRSPVKSVDAAPSRVVPRQLPADIGSFTGRDELLRDLDDVMAPSEPGGGRVVVVHGTGGVGKTTVVVHWARRALDAFPDGQLYVDLRGYGPGEPMSVAVALDTLLRGLGTDGQRVPAEVEARENLLRSMLADRRMLVVLDNARDAEQVRPLLPGAGASRVAVTSRNQLRGLIARDGARRVSVDQFEAAESMTMLRAAVPDVGDETALAELARLCGHLPLALAVAAERVSRQSDAELAELVAELRSEQERLDALDAGDSSTDVRGVFSWSYRALDDETAMMFRLLGLCPGPDFSLPAAAAVAGLSTGRTRRLLDRLVDANLLQQRKAGRYGLHDLLRAYAAELGETDPAEERNAAVVRLLDWYVHSVVNAWTVLWPNHPRPAVGKPPEPVSPLVFDAREQALAWFESERTALLSLVRIAAEHGQHAMARALTDALWEYLYRRRALDDLIEVVRIAAESAGRNGDQIGLATMTMRFGIIFMQRRDEAASRSYYEQARQLYEVAGDRVGQGRALANLGNLATDIGSPQEAVDFCERAVEWLVEAPREHAQGLNNLAVAYLNTDRPHDAYETVRRALDVGEDAAMEVDVASALDTLAQAQLALGQADEAIENLRQARLLLCAVGARWEEGAIVVNLGRALKGSGDEEAARAAWTEALDIIEELGAPDVWEFSRVRIRELLSGEDSVTATE